MSAANSCIYLGLIFAFLCLCLVVVSLAAHKYDRSILLSCLRASNDTLCVTIRKSASTCIGMKENMNRRQFLTIATVVTAYGMTHLAAPKLVAAKGSVRVPRRRILYQGTHDGKLYMSTTGKEDWDLIADFGEHCSIEQVLVQKNRKIKLKLACNGYKFELYSKDAQLWSTAAI